MTKETWRDVIGYEGLYQVSNLGNVKALNWGRYKCGEKILKQRLQHNGYCQVGLTKDSKQKLFSVHRLVAIAFLENLNNLPEVNHKDEDKTNNHVDNLEWCTPEYNMAYSFGKRVIQTDFEGNVIKIWNGAKEAQRKGGFDHSHIRKCCIGEYGQHKGFKWKYEN